MKRTLFLALAFLWGMCATYAQTATFHEVQTGETLYSIARNYHTTVDLLKQANPNLDADHIFAGQRLVLPTAAATQEGTTPVPVGGASPNRPRYKALHEVKKRETLYSISRQYEVPVDRIVQANPFLQGDKLKKGQVLNIPYSVEEEALYAAEQQRLADEAERARIAKSTIKVAVILPFSLAETMNAETQKMVNLYQGFLLTADSLKQRGYHIDISAYDEASSAMPVARLMQQERMKEMQLIVGPTRQSNIKSVAEFAARHQIAHVVPLSNTSTLVDNHPCTFQMNTPQTLLQNQVYNRFSLLHRDHRILFVRTDDSRGESSFVKGLKQDLRTKGMAFADVSLADLSAQLDESARTVLIPTGSSVSTFSTLCHALDQLDAGKTRRVQLFGYPEWQALSPKQDAYLNKYNCQFFTSFYSNLNAPATRRFATDFRRWFRQDQYATLPRYGELGHDIAAFFLRGIHDFGSDFARHLHELPRMSLQFPVTFERKDMQSGFQNRTVLIVTHHPNGTVTVQ